MTDTDRPEIRLNASATMLLRLLAVVVLVAALFFLAHDESRTGILVGIVAGALWLASSRRR